MATTHRTTRDVRDWRIWHRKCLADPTAGGPAAYAPWRDIGLFEPLEVRKQLAPRVHTAKVQLALTRWGEFAWKWRELVAFDDWLAVISGETDPTQRRVLFQGFVVEPNWTYGQADQRCVLTCNSMAQRLAADTVVHGRWMLSYAGDVTHYSGLPCTFNAFGRPNRHPDLQADVSGFASDYRAGVPVFTADNDPAAVWWTPADVFDYLMWRYNGDETWMLNYPFMPAAYGGSAAQLLGCEGMSLWAALAAAADRSGYDCYEYTANGGNGWPVSQVWLLRKHRGAERVVRHQAPGADVTLDLRRTNLLTANIAETVASAVTSPIVAGGRRLVEITVPLLKAWDLARLVVPAGSRIVPSPTEGQYMSEEYCRRYCVGGTRDNEYGDCGRLWDANSDGRYAGQPWNLSVPDVAGLADEAAGSWPRIAYRPRPMITSLHFLPIDGSPEAQVRVRISLDGGAQYQGLKLGDFQLLPDRLGIRLTAANLHSIVRESTGPDDQPDLETWNLFFTLATWPMNVLILLTCCIAEPNRHVITPARRPQAGTRFTTAAWNDRGAVGEVRRRAESSPLSDQPGDTADGAELTAVAEAIQSLGEDRHIEAGLAIEWPDEDLELTDQITRIDGLGYSLAINSGAAKRYPRIVGITHLLTAETYSMQLVLDTERQMGVI